MINLSAQKIDGSRFETFRMVIALFQLDDKDGKSRYFGEIFLAANISINVAFGILFLILSIVEVNFNN